MLDRDLAILYGVSTGNLNLAVKRNSDRFPGDFMFRLTDEELRNWVLQFARTNSEKMGLRYPPYAFTEMGVAMLSSVLKSKKAVQINIKVMRAFVELRQIIAAQPEYDLLKEKIKRIESGMLIQGKISDNKVTQLGVKVYELSELFDTFQTAHIIIRKPEEGLNKG